jgi:hypothetical protein
VSAVYDPFEQRLLVLVADSYRYQTPRIWELTLDDSPTWRELMLEGPAPGAELDQGRMVVDRAGKRVLIVGGGLNSSGTWALSLDGPTRWSRLTDAPVVSSFSRNPFLLGYGPGLLFVDSPRDRLALVTVGDSFDDLLFTLPLNGGEWSLEARRSCNQSTDRTLTYDSTHERVLFLEQSCGISSWSLSNAEWSTWDASSLQVGGRSPSLLPVSSIDDAKHGRAMYFPAAWLLATPRPCFATKI